MPQGMVTVRLMGLMGNNMFQIAAVKHAADRAGLAFGVVARAERGHFGDANDATTEVLVDGTLDIGEINMGNGVGSGFWATSDSGSPGSVGVSCLCANTATCTGTCPTICTVTETVKSYQTTVLLLVLLLVQVLAGPKPSP